MAKRRRLTPMPIETKLAELGITPPAPTRVVPLGSAPVAQVAGDAAGAGALQEMSDYIASARAEGRLIVTLPLARIEIDHMERDRLLGDDPGADEEMQALMASLRQRGQQVPIDVVRLTGDPRERYGLVSGLRRVTALRLLHREKQEAAFAEVKARLMQPESLPDAYRAMIEENEIRAGLSFYERARIALKAVEVGAFEDIRGALRGLYGNVSRAKRSKIGSFVAVVEALDGSLRFPAALSEKRGLALAKALTETPDLAPRLRKMLDATPAETGEAEQDHLTKALTNAKVRESPSKARVRDVPDVSRDGTRLIVSGPGVDASLHRDLLAWLRQRKSQKRV